MSRMSDIFESSLKEPQKKKRNLCTSSTHIEPSEEHSKPAKKSTKNPITNKECSPYSSIHCSTKWWGWESPDWPGVDFILVRRIGTTSPHKWQLLFMKSWYYRYLPKKRSCVYKAINSYQQIFWLPVSVNIKRGNPMIYGANFTQCICTGHCDS